MKLLLFGGTIAAYVCVFRWLFRPLDVYVSHETVLSAVQRQEREQAKGEREV